MGGRQSKPHRRFHHQTATTTGNGYSSPPPSAPYAPYAENYVNPHNTISKVQKDYTRIGDRYTTLEQVTRALAEAGLESSNLIVGVDFTKSNKWTGAKSFDGRCLHHIGDSLNPYEQAISIIGTTLSQFDEDNLIPCYGFGDATTHDQYVFSFYPDDRPCCGFEEALARYREIAPYVNFAGPTSFAPIIETAIGIVDSSGGQYHVLLIIADGQVTGSTEENSDHSSYLSSQQQSTIDAIVKASDYALSIILVGVGDGPWDLMHRCDDYIPTRSFDNFQFVNFTEIMSQQIPAPRKETEFALAALTEIPSQYKATIDFQLLGCRKGTPRSIILPPPPPPPPSLPPVGLYKLSSYLNSHQPSNLEQRNWSYHTAPSPIPTVYNPPIKNCPSCEWNVKDLAFQCGHQTCYECGKDQFTCPTCHMCITLKIRLCE